MEYYARRVRDRLGVPVALVSLVQADRQVFPGMVGLAEPWATLRCTPLTHSFCQYVVASERPLIVADAREHPWVADNLAVAEMGVAAYAGMPLTDDQGQVLGSLCAIDTVARRWSSAELETLSDLAHGCSAELRLRLARYDAAIERGHSADAEAGMRLALSQSHTLLAASQSLTQVSTVTDVRAKVAELVSTELAPTFVSMSLVGADGKLHRISDPARPAGPEDTARWHEVDLDASTPVSATVREQRVVHYPDRASLIADWPAVAGLILELGLQAIVIAPLLAGGKAIGALTLSWARPRTMSPLDLIAVTSIAGYTAQALSRVQLLQHRISVAHELQRAMLADLPSVDGVSLGARYLPADAREEVGGDWYDVTHLPVPNQPNAGAVAVSVGDIVGHDVHAATIMGQTRAMLRQACWSSACASPAAVIGDLEAAAVGVGLDAAGTVVLAHLRPTADGSGQWEMTWTNAGHPPPVILRPDGTTTVLDDHDIMLGYAHLTGQRRRDHHITLDPGTLVLLYTDGLVEHLNRGVADGRGQAIDHDIDHDLDHGIATLRELLSTLRGRSAQDIVDTVLKTLVTTAHDDTVALAITLDDPPTPSRSAIEPTVSSQQESSSRRRSQVRRPP
jgi:serine phosphatase RsbU (regulator of sigma subunit)